jgi:hypothetical protein
MSGPTAGESGTIFEKNSVTIHEKFNQSIPATGHSVFDNDLFFRYGETTNHL